MAVELLDIEAKLDTSQVQGQLSQLSKTSGLQNLDRAIRTLEQSMKRLSSVLDRQAQQAATSVGGGNPERLLGGKYIRSIGGYFIGRTLSEMGAATGNKTLKSVGRLAGSIATGAAAGGLLGNAPGAVVGASIGALDFAFKELADTTKRLNDIIEQTRKTLSATQSQSYNVQSSYSQKEFIRTAKEMSSLGLSTALPAARADLEAARQHEAEAQKMLADFESSPQYKNTLVYSVQKGVKTPEFRQQANEMQKVYSELVNLAKDAAEETSNAEQRLHALESRQKELARAEEKSAKAAEQAAKAEQRLAEHREKLRNGYAADLRSSEFQQKLDSLRGAAQFGGMSQEGIKTQASQAAFAYNVSMNELNKLRKEAMSSGTPEEYESRIKAKETEANEKKQLADMWQSMIDEPAMISLSEMMSKSVMPAVGNLNSLEQAGYFGMASQDKTIEDLTQQILNYVRRITANTETQTSTNDQTFGNY